MTRWIIYTLILGFAVYWASNLLLWLPWSYSNVLGMTLMLTVSPILWGYATLLSLQTYPGQSLMRGAGITAVLFLVLAAAMDYLFFGHIRNAMEQLYHPTTFYGYGFVLGLPFLLVVLFKNRLMTIKGPIHLSRLVKAILFGILCFGILMGIMFMYPGLS